MDLSDKHWRDHIMTNGPVGAWCALPGSHTQLFDEAIDFGVEGRGELRTHSPMRGAESLAFIWRVGGYGVVECQPVYASPEIGDDGQANAADWFRLPFVIELQRTDAGTFWALRERGAQGFWELAAPLVPVRVGVPQRRIDSVLAPTPMACWPSSPGRK